MDVRDAFIVLMLTVPLIVASGGVLIILIAIWRRTKLEEMRHRERMAMIDRGILPPPERDPAAFELHRRVRPPHRYTNMGVMLIGLGLALMMLIAFAGGEPGAAIGVGGALALLGVAFVVNGYLQRDREDASALSSLPPPPPRLGPTDPPGPIAP